MNRSGATQHGKQAARSVHDSTTLDVLIRVGLVAYGILHLVVAWLAVQVAWTHKQKQASSKGAIRTMAEQPFGSVLLWILAVGLAALAVWQLLEAAFGHRQEEGKKRLYKKGTSVGRAIVYLVLAFSAVKVVTSSGGSSKSSSKRALTARLLAASGGQLLVALVGVAIIAVGIVLISKAVRTSFKKDLGPKVRSGTGGDAVVRLGQVGYTAKGIALGIVGALFVWAAASYDPKKAGGLDTALKTLLDQPYGKWLLSLVALGLAAFGAYCLAWARDPAT